LIKAVGAIFAVGGLAALIYFLIHYTHHSKSFEVAGVQIAGSHGSIWPIIVTGIVMVVGIIILVSSRNK
jgi:hypothetical protein